MENIKIIFFDIDGTLLEIGKPHLSEKTREALCRLWERGIKLCIATGRSPTELPRFEGVQFDAWVTFNGSLCYTEKEIIFSNPIPKGDVERIIRNAGSIGRPVSVATRDGLYANGVDRDLADYYAIVHLKLEPAPDFADALKEDIYQLMLGCRAPEYASVLQDVEGAKIAAWWDRAADIIPSNGGKGVSVGKILEYFGLTPSQALAFGDGNNDLEMLQSVGTGVAMGNASEELKAVATAVCGSVAEDGIYHYCLEQGLI